MGDRFLKLYFLLGLFLMPVCSNAQSIGGGEVSYRLLSTKKYLVTAKVYRQCSGAPLNKLYAFVVSDSFKTAMSMKRTSIMRFDSTCGNPCNIVNDSSNAGYEQHTFTDTVDFNISPYNKYVQAGNCLVEFAVHQFIRSSTQNLASNSSSQSFYLNAMVNICQNIQKNQSPEFTFIPKLYACCNQPFVYNMGIVDSSDFDSLGLELTAPLSDYKTPVSYAGNFTSSIPMTPYCPPAPGVINCRPLPNAKPPRGFYFDKETGDIQFTPTKCDEIGVIKVSVNEYRKDSTNKFVLIGQVSREMFVTLKKCTDNNPSYITGNNKYSVCENKTLCFTIGTTDAPLLPKQTVLDTVTLFGNYGIPGATYTIIDSGAREKDMQFCWKSNKNNGSYQNRFSLMAYDKLCMENISSKGFIVYKKPSLNLQLLLQSKCNMLYYEIINIDSFNNNKKHIVYDVKVKHMTSPTQILLQSSKIRDSVKVQKSGKYYIEVFGNNAAYNCPIVLYDTIEINDIEYKIAHSSDTLFCFNDSVRLTPVPALSNSIRYQWYDSEKGKQIADSGSLYSFLNNNGFRIIHLVTKDKNNCILKDTVRIISRGAMERTPQDTALKVCENELTSIKINRLYGQQPFTISWYINNQYFSNDSTLNFKLANSAKIMVEIEDSFKCPYNENVGINVIKKPKIDMRDTALCYNDTVWISSKVSGTGNYTYEWTLDQNLSTQKGKEFKLNLKGDHLLNLKIKDGYCESQKTILVNFLPLPQFTIISDTVFNKADYITSDLNKTFTRYKWFNGTNTKSNEFWAYTLGTPGNYMIWCEVTDSNGCKSRETLKIRTNGRTIVEQDSYKGLLLYPNPVSNQLTIETQNLLNVEIYNSEGKLVYESRLNIGRNDIDVSTFASGIYTIKIDNGFYKVIKLP